MSPRLRYLSTTLALLAVALAYTLSQGWVGRLGHPSVPHPPATERPAAPPPVPPTAREILDRRAAFSLTADQVSRLEALDRQWKAESADLEARLRAATQEFSRFMDEARAGRGASVQQVQGRSAEVASLGAALREAREGHGDAAVRVLTEPQRQKLALPKPSDTPGGSR